MKKTSPILKTILLIWAIVFSVISTFAADRYSVATGNWNATSTWSATSGGASGASVPVAADNVIIEGGYTVTVNAASACANLSIASGSTLVAEGFNFTVNGTTTVDGIISHTSITGVKTFIGLVTVNAGGTWDNSTINESITLRGGITNAGTFNAGTGIYTFETNNQALTGTVSIPNVTVNVITLTNNETLTVGTALAGTGRLTQGVNATLDIGGASAITTLTASNSGNTVNFSGAAQAVNVSTYYNLTISGSGIKTLAGNTLVDGVLTLTAGTLSVGTRTLTLNGPTIAGTPENLATTASSSLVFGGTSSGVLIPSSVVALGGLSITNTNIVSIQSSPTISGTFNPAGAGLSIGANTLTLNGQINCGTLVGGTTSNIVIGGTGTASLAGVMLNNLTVNRATAMCGSVTVGGTLALNTGALSIAANTLTLSDGANLSYGGGSLTGGATSNLTIGTGTDFTINAISVGLNNFNTGRNIILGADLTVYGTVTLTAGTLTVGARTLTLNGPTIAGTPTNLVTSAASSLVFGGTSSGVLIPSSVVALGGLSIANTNIVSLQSSPTISGTFNPAGAGLSIGANTLTLNGPVNCGTLAGGATSNIVMGGATATNIPGVTLNNLTINRAVTLCGNVSVGGTLTLTSGALSIAANTLTLSDGANLSYGSGTLTGGATSNLNIGTGTDITLNAISAGLNNLNTSRNITLGADLTVYGTLTLTANTFTVGARTLTLNGPTIAVVSGNLLTGPAASLSFGGSSAGVSIPASVTNLNNLTINNINGVTLTGNITLATGGVLTLTSGIMQAGTNVLKITNTNPVTAIIWSPGSFVNVTSGTVERTLAANLPGTGNNYLFPIGEGGVFKGINLRDVNTGPTGPVLQALVSATGALTGDGVTIDAVDPRYWSLLNLNSGNLISAKVELYESGLDFSKTIGMSSAVAGDYTAIGGSSTTSSIISPTVLNPGPYFCIGASILDTYYSYQTGDWNSPTTWTSDPSGTLQIGATIPGDNDKVIILSGRTISLPSDIISQTLDIRIDAGGFLDQNIYRFTNGIYALRGQGTIKLASVNFPVTVINTLINAGGGTTEYNNISDFTLPAAQTTYNNLTINTPGSVATQLSNITLNANLHVKNGNFQINNNVSTVKLTLTINGNVTVDNGAFITVGNGVTNTAIGGAGGTAPFLTYYLNFHTVIVKGDFINNGNVRFTNLSYPVYHAFPPIVAGATSGAASVYFQGARDNTLNCNGVSVFYNLILDKGIDQTFKLTINSTDYSYFKLFGANTLATDGAVTCNPNLRKALWIRTGTLVLKGSVIIPSLSEGIAANSDYYIPSNGALVVDGVDVVVLSTADDYREINTAYTVTAPDNATIGVTKGGFSALDIFGKLQINNGYLSTRESGGLITSNIASGRLIIDGGTIDAKQLLSSTGFAAYKQSGGLFILRGRFQRTPAAYSTVADLTDISVTTLNTSRANNGINSGYGTFNLEQTGNIFNMSGGIIRIYDVCGIAAAEQESFDVKSSASNISVTGGTLEIRPTTGTVLADAASHFINTSAPLYNLLIDRASSTSVVQLKTSPLVVLNDLSLSSGGFTANNLNVTIGRNFSVAGGTSYIAGTNTTVFNGAGEQVFTVDLAAPLSLNKLTIDKPTGTALSLAGTQSTINVLNDFSLVTGSLNDNGKIINVAGNLYNSGIHGGSGSIILNGTLPQGINGNGVFGNLELNNTNAATAPVSLSANMTMNGVLTFSQDKLFNIGTYNLRLNSTASISNSGILRYIQSSGNIGDGGLTKVYSSPAGFTFPVGVINFTPASLGLGSAPTAYGSITVTPVNYSHPNVTTSGRSLSYFWRVKSEDFTLGAATVTHGYTYDQSNVVTGGDITEDEYVAARFNSSINAWTTGTAADVDDVANNIIGEPGSGSFLENVAFIDGDYTAGDNNPTSPFGAPGIFYSRINGSSAGGGLWSNSNNWSFTSNTGPANTGGAVPGARDIVIIGGNDSIYLATDLIVPNLDPRSCSNLQIEGSSALDIGFNPASVFSTVVSHSGGTNGNFRIACDRGPLAGTTVRTFEFPAGDFTDFNTRLGTTELYTTNPTAGTTFYLPNGITSYGNLIISPLGGSNIIFPNHDLTIFGTLITRGQNVDSWFCPSWDINYPTAPVVRVAKTITIMGNLNIQGGALVWYGNGAITQNVVVNGNVIVATHSSIDVWSGATSQSLSIGGSLINNTSGSGYERCDFTLLPVTFFGDTPASITNTMNNPVTILNGVTVNKGNSQATTLTCNIGGTLTTLTDNWLVLQNGTFRYMRTNPATDFTISTTTPFTIPATAGLRVDYANTNNRNILIGNASNNAGDLLLDGKFTLIRGSVYIGPVAAPVNNNDIEYSGGGASAIEIQGGSLVVNGQIRRNTSTTNGILNYTQSGGTVTINGNAANVGYAKLEVLNSGSGFSMSAGTLTIIRGGGTTYGDLYLRPESSVVTGGTIIFANGVPHSLQNYSMDASTPLNNLTITGDAGAGVNATVGLLVSPLALNGTLTLSNAQSIFNSNNLNVSIKGNLSNSGTYNFGTNTTTFDGGTQTVGGGSVTNFNNLNVLSTNSLTVNNNFAVDRDLSIGIGTLILGNKKLTLSGNLVNNGTYTDDNNLGGISLSGSAQQLISGTGAFGKLEINNSSGVKLTNGILLQNDLVLTRGIFNINSNLLTLSQNSSITGTPGVTNMIITDGVVSSLGVRKFFTTAAQSFTFPIGVAGKYTPAIFTIIANGLAGYINVNPINNNHPGVLDPLNVLKYYWQIESSGISGFTGNVILQYLPGDVVGVESDYVAAKLVPPVNMWTKSTDDVDETSHQINFLFSGSSNLNADYTAGNDLAFPAEASTYETNSNGNWSDQAIWTPLGSSPPCPVGGPTGATVIINHIVTTDISNIFAISTTINNELRVVAPTYGHSLGNVDGHGKIYLESGNLPGGNYTSFFDCSGNGTIEFGGTGDYTIIATQFSNLPNLFLTGTGTRVLPNKDLTICKRLVIDGPALDNHVNNSRLTVLGSMERYNTGSFISGSGVSPASTVIFAGTSAQTLGGPTGDFSGNNRFNNLEINNTSGLTIGVNGLVEISNELLLTNGIINTTSANSLILLSTSIDAVLPAGGSATSYVSGPLIKRITNGENFLYPVGKGTIKGHNFTLTSSAGSTLPWTAEYFTPNPTATSLTPPLLVSNTMEYWSISTSGSTSAKVKIGWDPLSALTPLMTENGIADMRVAEYISGAWSELASTSAGDDNNGAVATDNNVNISATPKDYTTASITPTIARASLSPSGPVCGTAGIPVSFTTFNPISLNYTLDYTLNNVPQPTINVTSLPYALPTPVPGAYQLTGFTYNNGVNTGVVDRTIINVYDNPPVSDAGPDQSLCGVSGTVLAGSDPGLYSGLWTIVSGAGGTLINRDLNTTVFTGVLGGSYRLRWTISNFTCTSSDDVIISFPVAATRPAAFTSAPATVCQGSAGIVYTVPDFPGNTYNWSYSGAGHTINGTGNSVTIDFSAVATSGTLSVTATNACGTSPARTTNVTVSPLPVATFSYSGTPYCPNAANPLPAFSGGGVAGTFSSTAGLVFVSVATGQVNLAASTPGSYTVTNTIAPSGSCGQVTATSSISIISDYLWTGASGTDWNNAGNWSCGIIPNQTNSVQIPDVPNKPVLNAGSPGIVYNLVIENGSSLVVTGNTIRVSGTITNSGTLNVTGGTVEMNGLFAQTIGNGVFSGNTVRDLIINNPGGVTLQGPLNITGSVALSNGNLASDGFLTLVSTAAGTAYVSGTGSGNITGNVTMQRYLPNVYGYKYLSSPFQAATVSEFGDDMNLASTFPLFYRYDEARTSSGWVGYVTPSNLLLPLHGYSVNFGVVGTPGTVDVTGVVNNGPILVTLLNNNNTYTKGFNLVGNPYPSAINWNDAGWTKTNIDNAVYYFRASTTDQYGGIYSSYVNGISTAPGIATNIIPSMQAFFVHVSDGTYPVTGTLGLTNSVRINDRTHNLLKSAEASEIFLIRATASFTDDTTSSDPTVIYFTTGASPEFDNSFDALKLLNTDMRVANVYSMLSVGTRLSVNALPESADTSLLVPLGLRTNRDGEIMFKIPDLENLPEGVRVYFRDKTTGANVKMLPNKDYKVVLTAGTYNDRFSIAFLKNTTGIEEPESSANLFTAYASKGMVKATVWVLEGRQGTFTVYDLNGQPLFVKKVYERGRLEFNPLVKPGIYIVSFGTGSRRGSLKMALGF